MLCTSEYYYLCVVLFRFYVLCIMYVCTVYAYLEYSCYLLVGCGMQAVSTQVPAANVLIGEDLMFSFHIMLRNCFVKTPTH